MPSSAPTEEQIAAALEAADHMRRAAEITRKAGGGEDWFFQLADGAWHATKEVADVRK